MARERVQVQGLGGAVPGIQPTIQRAGQYAVAQVRAAPVQVPRSKLLDLADTLKAGQDVLQQYGLAAKQEAEIFEDELSRKSPEEIQAMLKKTEGELDKQVRRGAMGWLTSPLNQKRKLRAVGKLASRDLVSEIQQRLLNPAQDDPEDAEQRVSLVRQQFIENTPALQSVFAQEGLNESTNASIKELVVNYELQQAKIAKEETLFATGASMYDKIETLTENLVVQEQLLAGDFNFTVETLEDGSTISLGDYITKQWDETGAYTPKEQRALLSSLLKKMATNGMEDQADGLLLWAKSNLKFGNSSMSNMEFEDLEFLVDKAGENAEQRREEDNQEFADNTDGSYKIALTKLKLDETVVFDGETFTDKLQLSEHFKRKIIDNPDLSNEQKGDLLDKITASTQGSFRDAETYTKKLILADAPEASARGVGQALSNILTNSDIPDVYKNRPEVQAILNTSGDKIKALIDQRLDSEFIGLPTDKAAEKATAYARELIQNDTARIQAEIKAAYDVIAEREKSEAKGVLLGEEAPEEPKLPEPDGDSKQLLKLLPTWQNFVTKDPNDEKSNKAKKYIEQYTPQIANDAAREVFDKERFRGVFSTSDEDFISLHLQASSRMNGVFSLDVLEQVNEEGVAYTYAGVAFKPKEFIGNVNAGNIVILTEEQLANKNTDEGLAVISRAKEAAGITFDVYEFIRLQEKRRKKFVVDYVPFPDMYKPLDEAFEIQQLIKEQSSQQFDPLPDFIIID
jgi:hypothetical protein